MNLNFNIASPFLLGFLSLSRLMVVLYPLNTKFKSTKFAITRVFFLLVTAFVISLIITVTMFILYGTVPLSLCSPFVDPTDSILLIKIITWFIVIIQFVFCVKILFVHNKLIQQLRKPKGNIQKTTSKKRQISHLPYS